MIRRVVFALIVGGASAPWASAQSTPTSMPPASPSPPVYATPQAPPRAEVAEGPPPPPKPAETARPKERVASAESTDAAKRSITRLNPLPRQATTFQQTNDYARRELLMDQGRYANPGGVGRRPEYYTANTPISQANLHPAPLAGFDRGGGPNRAEQIAAFQAGQFRARNIQNNINAYGRPYGAFGAGFGFGFGLSGAAGLYGGGLR